MYRTPLISTVVVRERDPRPLGIKLAIPLLLPAELVLSLHALLDDGPGALPLVGDVAVVTPVMGVAIGEGEGREGEDEEGDGGELHG